MLRRFAPSLVFAVCLLALGLGVRQVWPRPASPRPLTPDQTCTLAVRGDSYVLRVTGPTAQRVCAHDLAAARSGRYFPLAVLHGPLRERRLVCGYRQPDGDLHQIYSGSDEMWAAQMSCNELRAS